MIERILYVCSYSFYSAKPVQCDLAVFTDGREALDYCEKLKSANVKYLVCDPLTPVQFIKAHLRKRVSASVQLAVDFENIGK